MNKEGQERRRTPAKVRYKHKDKNYHTAQRILEAAKTEFAERGYYDARIRAIAKMARVSPSTIYEYYPSKEQLLLAIPENKLRELLDTNKEHVFGIDSALEKIKNITWVTLRFYESDPDLATVIYMVVTPHKSWCKCLAYSLVRERGTFIEDILADGQKKGEIRNDVNTYFMRHLYLGGIHRLIVNWLRGEFNGSLISLAPSFNNLITSALRKPVPNFVIQPLSALPAVEENLQREG